MSDESSYGSVATEVPPSVEPEAVAGRSSKALLVAVGVAVAVLGVFAYLLFFRGGAPEATGPVPQPVAPAPAASVPVETDEPAAEPANTAPQNSNVQGRNPFIPLEVEKAEDGGTGGAAPSDVPADTGNPTDPGSVPTTPTTPTTPTGDTVTVKLVSVKGDLVATKVGNVNYTGLSAGDTFGTNFQVYAIFNDSCAGFLYGDDSFALCEGKTATLAKS